MASLRPGPLRFCVLIISGCLPVTAQSASYHLEVEVSPSTGPTQSMALVNDSEKSIVAYSISQQCGNVGNASLNDFLNGPRGTPSNVRAADGSLSRSGALEPAGKWLNVMYVNPQNGACHEEVTVLFEDGTFEGKEAAIRALKAHRDGIVAGVNLWADRLGHEAPDGSGVAALILELKSRASKDAAEAQKYPSPFRTASDTGLDVPPEKLLSAYWYGRRQVDGYLDLNLNNRLTELAKDGPSAVLRFVTGEIDAWKKRIDGDRALKKLNETFPPVTTLIPTEGRSQ